MRGMAIAACFLLAGSPAGAAFEKGGLLGLAPRVAALGGITTALTWDAAAARGFAAGLASMSAPHVVAAGGVASQSSLRAVMLGAGGMVDGLGVAALLARTSHESSHESAGALGIGLPVEEARWLSLGMSLKVLAAGMAGAEGRGFGLDASALARVKLPWEGFDADVIAGIEDVLGSLEWDDGLREDLDRQARVGASVRWARNLAVHSELRLIRGAGRSENMVALGLERELAVYSVPVALRLGWRDGEEREASFGGGAGVHLGPASADYAIVGMTGSEGYIHSFAVTWAFGDVGVPLTRWVVRGARGGVAPEAGAVRITSPYQEIPFNVTPPRDYHRIASWAVVVMDGDGIAVWSVEGTDVPPGVVSWNGTADTGAQAPAGSYTCQLLLRGPGAYRYMSRPAVFRLERSAEAVLPGETVDPEEFDAPLIRR